MSNITSQSHTTPAESSQPSRLNSQSGCNPLLASRSASTLPPSLEQLRQFADGEYAWGRLLGEGARAAVYAATELSSGRSVAIKVPKERSPAANRAIKTEYRNLRQLAQRSIVSAHRLLRFAGGYALVLEPLRAAPLLPTLRNDLTVGQLPDLDRLRNVLSPLVAALATLHGRGWIHGDIKPAHVLWNNEGQPCWIDFETATRCDRPLWSPARFRTDGTFAYLAPEAIAVRQPQTASDIFSLGRLLAVCLSGRLPCWDPSHSELRCQQRIASQLPHDTPTELLQLCVEMLNFDPAERPSADQVLAKLRGDATAAADATTAGIASAAEDVTAKENSITEESTNSKALRDEHRAILDEHSPAGPRVVLLERNSLAPEAIEEALALTPGDSPRLLLSAWCERSGETAFPSLDPIFAQLGDWLGCLPAAVRQAWTPPCENALAVTSPELAETFGLPTTPPSQASTAEIEQATNCLVRLLESIAGQRRLVFVLHNVEWLDPASGRLLNQLLSLPKRNDVIVVATTANPAAIESNVAAQTLLRSAHTSA